ncbi:MAG TPA: carboxypeptidase regulatory-like domain-containing protein, partial [Polyangiaceae bacterium]
MRTLGAVGFVPLACLVTVAACAGSPRSSADAPASDDAAPPLDGGDAGNLVGNGDASGHPCVGLECQRVDCAAQGLPDTTVSGVVFDPAGQNPLYDVIVYIPNAPLAPLTAGVTCDQCGVLASGSPISTALTGPSGKFLLADVPAGDGIPLVIQLGKWRRQLVIPNVAPCRDNPMSDPRLMRLPAKQSEGDMPQMAVATGGCDPFECLLRKIGIDRSEFTEAGGGGKVHLYQGTGGSGLSATTPTAAQLWA